MTLPCGSGVVLHSPEVRREPREKAGTDLPVPAAFNTTRARAGEGAD